ncbi:MAG: hypothetical protein DRH57_05830 [Candidatus Cloacimonadota bacterium]|nr:MAG: hypothetical protein DRH57_05830 [Candidatus Cloacimonadota bacterium]
MQTKKITVPIEIIIQLLKRLKDEEKEEIFKEVFIEEDTQPLTEEERISINIAEEELKKGETISWPFGG